MVGQSLLDLFGGLRLELLGRCLAHVLTRRGIAGGGMPLCLRSVEILDDALVVLLDDVLGDTLHTENLDVKALPVRERILDVAKVFLVHLVHVNRQAYPKNCQTPFAELLHLNMLRVLDLPPAVFKRLPHRSHLKCFAFW